MSKKFEEEKKKAFLKLLESGDSNTQFDIYSQDPNEWAWLEAFIPGIQVTSAGGLIPFQAEGTLHGHPFYYRERGGEASLNVGDLNGGKPYIGDKALWSASEEVEEFRSGPEWIVTLIRLVDTLDRSPFRYEFLGKEVNITGGKNNIEGLVTSEREQLYSGWGFSAEEAFAAAHETSKYLLEYLEWEEEFAAAVRRMRNLSPVPVNQDTRDYPEDTPDFRVTVPESWRDEDGKVSPPENFLRALNGDKL